ncbi:MAG: Glycosyl transferase, family 2 [candidate division WWE3 bacterium GW2011_GWC1_41_7]|uniref:Glycosyl transferase, family 2 n=3 Tax=Katanobacteria TaxID=422282 RepID=A0A0G0X877_UNCKA|nr:MAG: Glycosyl transferase, family 2 [candidate division WWE3 bacterium GW2011_GWB1_41_6]KKS21120.1 MAG: Glycosyl transferase, family 2 [candidate division WWE3 bacterium GW2011_GWC1_41_7]
MLVSIIVPAYKQEKTIKEDIEKICTVMNSTRFDFEMIVVVDGFLDNTYEEASAADCKKIKVLGYENNKGKGYAVRYGMARSTGEYVAFIDAGMEIDPNGISMMLEQMIWYEADIMVASKRHPASKVKYYSRLRKLYSWGYQMIVWVLFGLKIKDTQTGLKVYRRELLERVLPRLVVKEFAFDVELLAVARHLGFDRIFEAPVKITLNFTEESKIKRNKPLFLDPTVRGVLWDTASVFYRIYLLRYYEDRCSRKWIYDEELDMRINTGEFAHNQ